MNLPFAKKNHPTTPAHEQFFAIQIGPENVKSAVWSVYNNKPQVLAVGMASGWDGQTQDSLLLAADQSVSDTLSRLDPTGMANPQKVIFGLMPNWIENEKISPARIQLIKNLSTKLELKPIGFVPSSEAMLRHVHSLEGVPPTAIFLGFWQHHLEICVARLGRNEGTFLIDRSQNPVEDVLEGLHRFGHLDMLPSRMLLYDSGTDLEDIRQLLLSYPWQSPQNRLNFLHYPKIESLPFDFSVRSVALSGGGEVASAMGIISDFSDQPDPTPTPASAPKTDLGFTEHQPSPNMPDQEVYIPLKTPPAKLTLPSWPVLKISPPKMSWVVILVVLILVTLSTFAAYWYLPTAEVTLWVAPKDLVHRFDLLAKTNLQTVDLASLSVPATVLDATVSDKASTSTTGTKTVGTKATAKVTIFNGTDGPYKFAVGTSLTSPSGLKYLTLEAVSVASASGTVVTNLQPGKAEVKVEAAQIGSEYNLDANTTLKVASFSTKDIAAQNTDAFTGGTSKKVQAVAKEDLSKLRTTLSDKLKTKAAEDLTGKVSDTSTLIVDSITTQTKSEDFSAKQGDEADTLELTLTLQAQGLVVKDTDLSQLVDSQVAPLVPPGYRFFQDPKPSFTVKKIDKDAITFTAQISSQLLPKVDEYTVLQNIIGKYPNQAQEYLKAIPGVTKVEFVVSPALPSFFSTLPHVSKNIKLEISPNDTP